MILLGFCFGNASASILIPLCVISITHGFGFFLLQSKIGLLCDYVKTEYEQVRMDADRIN
ncbi:hypothetical protein AL536_22845 [Vibrio fluvialis]|uniref:Uncharacterized protein n=1 Tax=Vibrio fluvialis TaxID=676 RepID=A0ABM6RLW5_VIBFL|nr:hypothetical protein AL536_22845 [Vibrio fluvialis]EKO3963544.1 hypothetical protein [Vibrio fluvialis]EKO3969866.1 hypothetical protein [Vibrio fluvialis]EKO3982251.1 hypothetical protein [Vibrio fluvialis]EKO3985150.1 hypothetical protein [Vibrio fluvialis]